MNIHIPFEKKIPPPGSIRFKDKRAELIQPRTVRYQRKTEYAARKPSALLFEIFIKSFITLMKQCFTRQETRPSLDYKRVGMI